MKKLIVIFVGISMFLTFLSYGEEKPTTENKKIDLQPIITQDDQKFRDYGEYLKSLPIKPNLWRIEEIGVLINIDDKELELLGVRKEDIENEVIVLLKNKLPQVKILQSPIGFISPIFYVSFTVAPINLGGEVRSVAETMTANLYSYYPYYSEIETLAFNSNYYCRKTVQVIYWEWGTAIAVILKDKSYWGQTKGQLEDAVTSFAASWYKDNQE